MGKQDISFDRVSPRQSIALRLSDTLLCLGLNDAYGIDCQRATDSKGKPHWSITFCRARTVDGLIRVYSERYILVTFQQSSRQAQRFTSLEDAQRWLMREFNC